MTPSEWLRRVAAVEATLLRSKRIPLNILVVNDPDAVWRNIACRTTLWKSSGRSRSAGPIPQTRWRAAVDGWRGLTEAARGPRTSPGRRET